MTTPAVPAVPAIPAAALNPGEVKNPALVLPVDPGNTPPVPKEPVKKEQTAEEIAAAKKTADEKTLADAKALTDAKALEDAKTKEGWQKEYVKIDNEDAQAAVDLMNEAGVSPIEANAIFEKAIASKDMSDIDWPTLEAKIGPAKTRLVKNGIEKYFTDVVAVQTAVTEQAYEIMGSQENWVTVRAWAQAKEKADPAYAKTLTEYRKAIDGGGFAAKAAVNALKADYTADPKTEGLGQATVIRGDTQAVVSGSPLSRSEYNAALHKAHKANSPASEIEALHNRRRAGMQAERASR